MAEENIITEILSRKARLKKSRQFKKASFRKKAERTKKKNLKKVLTRDKAEKRSAATARRTISTKLAGGRSKSELSISQKETIEKRLQKPGIQAKIKRLTKKGIAIEKKKDKEKKAAKRSKKANESVTPEEVIAVVEEMLFMEASKKSSDLQLLGDLEKARVSKDKKKIKELTKELKRRGVEDDDLSEDKHDPDADLKRVLKDTDKKKKKKVEEALHKDDEDDEETDDKKKKKKKDVSEAKHKDDDDNDDEDGDDKKKKKKGKKTEIVVTERLMTFKGFTNSINKQNEQ